jgi:hypothetical protein
MILNARTAGLALVGMLTFTPIAWAQHGHGPQPHTAPSTTTTTTSTTTTKPTTPTTTTNPVCTHIQAHPQLAAKVTALLPKNTTLETASMGYKNQGQLIAALHVSRNLNIPFSSLKMEMTGPDHLSLGQTIHKLRPTVDSKTATKKAESEADDDVKSSDK